MGIGLSVPREHPYHSTTLYNGKVLEPLPAVDAKRLKRIEYGTWSNAMPEQLSRIIQQPERYKEAIRIINTDSQTEETMSLQLYCLFKFKTYRPLLAISIGLMLLNLLICVGVLLLFHEIDIEDPRVILAIVVFSLLDFWLHFLMLVNRMYHRIVYKLQKAIAQANVHLFEEKILMGARSNSKLDVIYVSLDGCKLELCGLSHDDELFKKYISEYSSAYTCCLAQRYFPFKAISQTGHLEGALCFCQYVIRRLSMKRCCFCCRKQYVYSPMTTQGESNVSYA